MNTFKAVSKCNPQKRGYIFCHVLTYQSIYLERLNIFNNLNKDGMEKIPPLFEYREET